MLCFSCSILTQSRGRFGAGLDGTVYIVRDPHEMLKVLKQEGAYPSGAIQKEWPTITWMEKRHFSSVGLFGQGPEWKRLRSFMQKDLLAPQSAREYMPIILQGAEIASRRAKESPPDDVYLYLNYCASDLFSGVVFGGHDAKGLTESDYRRFCDTIVAGIADLVEVVKSPLEHVYHKVGLESKGIKRYHEALDEMFAIANQRLDTFIEQIEAGDLSEMEKGSYFYKLMERQPESDLTKEEVIELSVFFMIAAVDTTSSKTAWNLAQLSIHPEFQEKLYQQIKAAVDKEGGLTAGIFERNEVPLLSACIRETHRCTPALFADILKTVADPTDVYGMTLPPGSTIMFDSLTNMMDPELVDDPMTFKPERWLPEAVAARKDSPQAIIDHPFYSGPFSQGARRCPGSRVALLEVQAMIARLLLDFRLEGPKNTHWKDYPSVLRAFMVPKFTEFRMVPRLSS